MGEMQNTTAAQADDNKRESRWGSVANRIKNVKDVLRIREEHEDPTAKYLQEKGIISRRHGDTFDADTRKIERIKAYYDKELKFGSYTVRIKPVMKAHEDPISLSRQLMFELGFNIRRDHLYDNKFIHASAKAYATEGYIEFTIHCSKDGAYERVVRLMNVFLEDCIKKYEGVKA